MTQADERKYITRNRKAYHDYEIIDTWEAGIALKGSEVKSIRDGKVNISDAYASVGVDGVILHHLNITPYKMAGHDNHDPTRPRRLLLHKREIAKLRVQTEQKGNTLIPLGIYISGGRVKVELALAVGRKKYDKREAIAKADADRRIRNAVSRERKQR
jgi:SsrA-binding protein